MLFFFSSRFTHIFSVCPFSPLSFLFLFVFTAFLLFFNIHLCLYSFSCFLFPPCLFSLSLSHYFLLYIFLNLVTITFLAFPIFFLLQFLNSHISFLVCIKPSILVLLNLIHFYFCEEPIFILQ